MYKCKNIFTKILKAVGIEVPKSIEIRSKCSMHAGKGRDDSMHHNMRNPFLFTDVGIWGYVCYDYCMLSSPAFACMLHFDLVSILFGTSIPTSFNILVKMFLHLFHCFYCV